MKGKSDILKLLIDKPCNAHKMRTYNADNEKKIAVLYFGLLIPRHRLHSERVHRKKCNMKLG